MPLGKTAYLTVSPPTFDRCAFAQIDALLADTAGPYNREWLMSRFAEGLQIRMLRPPFEGLVVFQPGRLAWRPVEGLDRAVFVQDLRVAPGPLQEEAKALLWQAVEDFAQFYDYPMTVAQIGPGEGLLSNDVVPMSGWITVDHGPEDVRLIAKILTGPIAMPAFPRDWRARAAALGKGVVIQTTDELCASTAQTATIASELERHGVSMRLEHLDGPNAARHKAVSPGATFSVVLNGVRLGGSELSPKDILAAL